MRFFLIFGLIFFLLGIFDSPLNAQEKNLPDSTKAPTDSTAIHTPPDSIGLKTRQDSLSPQTKVTKNTINNDSWKITQKLLRRVLIQDITDIFQMMPSVTALNLGNPGQLNPLIFRGGKPQQSRSLINDMVLDDVISGKLNSIAFPFHVLDTLSYQTGNSILSGVTGDAVLMKTIEITSKLPYSNIRYMTGDWNYSDLNAIFGLPLSPRSNLLISGGRQKYGGFLGQDREIANSRLFATYRRRFKQNLELNFTGLLNQNEAAIPDFLPPDFIQNVQTPRKEEKRLDGELSLSYESSNASYGLDAGISMSRVYQESFNNTTTLFDNRSVVTAFKLQNTFRRTRAEYRLGVEFRLMNINSEQTEDLRENIKTGYAGVNFDLSEKLNVDLLAAIEKHKSYKTEFNPGLMINYKVSEDLRVWSSIKKYSRYPTYVERFWPLQFYMGNAYLKPERVRSIDLGLKAKAGDNIELQTAVFYKSIHDWVENGFNNTGDAFSFRNIENYSISGLELKSNWRYFKAGNLGMTASFLNFNASEPIVPYSPEFILHAYLEAGRPFFQNYVFPIFRLNGRFYSVRTGWLYSGASQPRVVERPSVMIFDAQFKLVFESAIVTVAYENLFDEFYEFTPGFLMPPRSLVLGIDWEFWD